MASELSMMRIVFFFIGLLFLSTHRHCVGGSVLPDGIIWATLGENTAIVKQEAADPVLSGPSPAMRSSTRSVLERQMDIEYLPFLDGYLSP